MITGINLLETKDFVSKYDKGDPQTVWKLGIVSGEAAPIVNEHQDQTVETMTRYVSFGLKGFENFRSSDGKEIQYKTEQKIFRGQVFHVLANSVLSQIPEPVILELGIEIMKLGNLTEDEQKNS